jgi:hypothetical protein
LPAAAARTGASGALLRNRFLFLLHARVENREGFIEAPVDLSTLVLGCRRAAAGTPAARTARRRAAGPATGATAARARTLAGTASGTLRAARSALGAPR